MALISVEIKKLLKFSEFQDLPDGLVDSKINSNKIDAIAITGSGSTQKYWLVSSVKLSAKMGMVLLDDSQYAIPINMKSQDLSVLLSQPGWIATAQDAERNIHIYIAEGNANYTSGLRPTKLVLKSNGDFASSARIDLLKSELGTTKFIDTSKKITVESGELCIYTAEYNLFNEEGEPKALTIGSVIAKNSISAMNYADRYFIDLSISIENLSSKNLIVVEKNDSLLLLWMQQQGSKNSNYLIAKKNDPVVSAGVLDLPTLIKLETDFQADLNQDGSIGKIRLIAPDTLNPDKSSCFISQAAGPGKTITQEIFKLSNGDLVTKKSTAPKNLSLPLGTEFDFAQISDYFKILNSADIYGFEIRQTNAQKIDLNDDGIIGAAVQKIILRTDNFSIYQTTLGDIVYSDSTDLNTGDNIPVPITIPFTGTDADQSAIKTQICNGKNVVASIVRSGTTTVLKIGIVTGDPLSDFYSLRELTYNFVISNSPVLTPSTTSPLKTYLFNQDQAARLDFLQQETVYALDLNNDGVIGDAIVRELTTSSTGSIYQLASGSVFFSLNTQLNRGDSIDRSTSIKIFDYANSPDEIYSGYLGSNILYLIYSSNGSYFNESFLVSTAGTQKIFSPIAGTKVSLSAIDLTQSEISYSIDIDGDGYIGDSISKVEYGYASSNDQQKPSGTNQEVGVYALKNKTAFLKDAYIISNNAGLSNADRQPSSGAYTLKNGGGSADTYWSIPTYYRENGVAVYAKVVAAGLFSDSGTAARIVLRDRDFGQTDANYYLVTFDDTGTTKTPRGNLLNKYALNNEEVNLNTDINRDGSVGDTATKLASNENFAIYQLNNSGAIVVRKDNGWESDLESIQQISTDFLSLKNSNGSTWLPFGYEQSQNGSVFKLINNSGASKITQVAFNLDGSLSVYLVRTVVDEKGVKNTLYNVEFNNKGITKNQFGNSLTQIEIYSQELKKQLDINGDGFVGKPYLSLENRVTDGAHNSDFLFLSSANDSSKSLVYSSTEYTLSALSISSAAKKNGLPTWASGMENRDAKYSNGVQYFYSNLTKQNYLIFSDSSSNGFKVVNSKAQITYETNSYLYARPKGLGDFNGDGVTDLLLYSPIDVSLATYKGNDRGSFVPLQKFMSPISNAISDYNIHVATSVNNFNSDKFSDLAVLQYGTQIWGNGFSSIPMHDELAIFINKKGNLKLSEKIDLGIYGDIKNFLSADLNNDGAADLIFVRENTNSIELAFNAQGKFSYGGEFIDSTTLSGIYRPKKAGVTDINGDGFQDIIVLAENQSRATQIVAYYGNGKGDFLAAQLLMSQDKLLYNQSSSEITDFAIQDLNGDKLSEIVLYQSVNNGYNTILWNLSGVVTGSQKFSTSIATGSTVAQINFYDFQEKAGNLGLIPSITSNSSVKITDIEAGAGSFKSSMQPLFPGGQLQISTGKSSTPEISLSLHSSVRVTSNDDALVDISKSSQPGGYYSNFDAGYGSYTLGIDNSQSWLNKISNFSSDDQLIFSDKASIGIVKIGTSLMITSSTSKESSHLLLLQGITGENYSFIDVGLINSISDLNSYLHDNVKVPKGTLNGPVYLKIPVAAPLSYESPIYTLGNSDFHITFEPSYAIQMQLKNFDSDDRLYIPRGEIADFDFSNYGGIVQMNLKNAQTPFSINFLDILYSDFSQQVSTVGVSEFFDYDATGQLYFHNLNI